MNRGIRTVAFHTFATCVLLHSCARSPNGETNAALDDLITATDAAMLTLNELDRGRYVRTDSLYETERPFFLRRFQDTLDRERAQLLGEQYVALRAAREMGHDHDRVLASAVMADERLRALRADHAHGAIGTDELGPLLAQEQRSHLVLMEAVHATIDNYRTLQRTWERADSAALFLAERTNATAR